MAIVITLLGSLGREAIPTVVEHSNLWLLYMSFGRLFNLTLTFLLVKWGRESDSSYGCSED